MDIISLQMNVFKHLMIWGFNDSNHYRRFKDRKPKNIIKFYDFKDTVKTGICKQVKTTLYFSYSSVPSNYHKPVSLLNISDFHF